MKFWNTAVHRMETNYSILITLCNPNDNILYDWKINYVFGVC